MIGNLGTLNEPTILDTFNGETSNLRGSMPGDAAHLHSQGLSAFYTCNPSKRKSYSHAIYDQSILTLSTASGLSKKTGE